jgi:hypothetical protein
MIFLNQIRPFFYFFSIFLTFPLKTCSFSVFFFNFSRRCCCLLLRRKIVPNAQVLLEKIRKK